MVLVHGIDSDGNAARGNGVRYSIAMHFTLAS